jgi:hypothetical protein
MRARLQDAMENLRRKYREDLTAEVRRLIEELSEAAGREG